MDCPETPLEQLIASVPALMPVSIIFDPQQRNTKVCCFPKGVPRLLKLQETILLLAVGHCCGERRLTHLGILESCPQCSCAHTKVSHLETVVFFFYLFAECFKWNKCISISMELQSAISSPFTPAGDPETSAPPTPPPWMQPLTGALLSFLEAWAQHSLRLAAFQSSFSEGYRSAND